MEEGPITKWLKSKGQKDKQRSTKHYTENARSSNSNPTTIPGLNQMLHKGKQFLFH